MTTKTKATKATAPAKGKAKPAPAAKRNGALDPTSKFVWAGKDNPFKEGSGAHGRIEILKKLSGQPVQAIRGYRGLKKTTLATALRMGLGRVG
jgi:hypothetical protein